MRPSFCKFISMPTRRKEWNLQNEIVSYCIN